MKGHLRHYKLLVALVYVNYPWVERQGLAVTLRTGPMARHFKLKSMLLRRELRRLHTEGFIVSMDFQYGVAYLELRAPLLQASPFT